MLFLLDRDVKTVKWNGIPLHEVSSAVVKEELNGDFVLTMTYPITDSGVYQLIKEDMLIKAPTPVLGEQLFRIKKPVEQDDRLDITAYHISDDIMQRSIRPMSVVGQACGVALSQMIEQAKAEIADFSFASDIMSKHTFNTTEDKTLYSILLEGKHSIVGTWEGELIRDNFTLSVSPNRGADRGVIITTHKSLKSYQRTKNSQEVVTRIYAKSSFREEGAEEDTVLRVVVDSPLIGDYPYIHEREYENNTAKTVDDLRKWAEAKFKHEGIDKVGDRLEIEAYELDGQEVHLGDTVTIKSRKHQIDICKKAIAYEYNPLTKRYISLTFDDQSGLGGSGLTGGVAAVAGAILDQSVMGQEVVIERAIQNANRHFEANFEKKKVALEEEIERSRARAEVYADRVRQELGTYFSEAERRYQANQSQQAEQLGQLFRQAGASQVLAEEAKRLGQSAQADVSEALARARQAKEEAVAEAQRLVTTERQETESRLALAKGQAVSEASRLVEGLKASLGNQLSNTQTDLTQTKEAIKLLASKQTVDGLSGRVASAESSLQVQADQIAQSVKKQDFGQATGRLSSAESAITQLGNRITTEISETVAKIPTNYGQRNLILKSADFSNAHRQSGDHRTRLTSEEGCFILKSQGYEVNSWSGISWNLALSEVKAGEQFALYMPVYIERSVTCDGGFALEIKNHAQQQSAFIYTIPTTVTGRWIEVAIPITIRRDIQLEGWNFYVYLVKNGLVRIKPPILVRGHLIPLQHVSAPEDMIEELTSVKTTVTQTADGQQQLSTRLVETVGKVVQAETQIRNLVGEVSSKVGQRDFDRVKQTVENQETQIQQTRNQIQLKADKVMTDNLTRQVSQAQSELTVVADGLKAKVSQRDFDQATGRLATAESSIETMAGKIETKLSQADVNGIVSNRIEQSERGMTARISQVEGKIPTEIGGRNYILESDTFITTGSKSFQLSPDFIKHAKGGKTIVISLEAEASNLTSNGGRFTRIGFELSVSLSNNTTAYYNCWLEGLSNRGRQRYSFVNPKLPDGVTITEISYCGLYIQVNGQVTIGKPKVEIGQVPTDWTPAPEDMVRMTSFHEVRDTVDSHTRTIANQGQSISQLVQTSNGLVSRVASLAQTNLVYDPTNYSKYRERESGSNLSLISTVDYKLLRITQSGRSTNGWRGFQLPLHSQAFVAGEKLSYRVNLWVDSLPDGVIGFEIKAGGPVATFTLRPSRTGQHQIFTGTFTVNRSVITTDDFGLHVWLERNGQVAIGQLMIVRGEVPPQSFVDTTSAQQLATESQVSHLAGSYAIQNLTSAGSLISGINLGANGYNRISGRATQITGETLIDNAVIKSAMIDKLKTANFEAGSISGTILSAESVTANQLKVDQAFFDKLTANEAHLRNLFAQRAFISQVQSVDISANRIIGGLLQSTNANTRFDMNSGELTFNDNNTGIFRTQSNASTQGMMFLNDPIKEGVLSRTIIGAERRGNNLKTEWRRGGFNGFITETIRGVASTQNIFADRVHAIGDRFYISHTYETDTGHTNRPPEGWVFTNYPVLNGGVVKLEPFGINKRQSQIEVGDIRLMNADGSGYWLKEVLRGLANAWRHYANGGFSDSSYRAGYRDADEWYQRLK